MLVKETGNVCGHTQMYHVMTHQPTQFSQRHFANPSEIQESLTHCVIRIPQGERRRLPVDMSALFAIQKLTDLRKFLPGN